jgi:hypothetical protein
MRRASSMMRSRVDKSTKYKKKNKSESVSMDQGVPAVGA